MSSQSPVLSFGRQDCSKPVSPKLSSLSKLIGTRQVSCEFMSDSSTRSMDSTQSMSSATSTEDLTTSAYKCNAHHDFGKILEQTSVLIQEQASSVVGCCKMAFKCRSKVTFNVCPKPDRDDKTAYCERIARSPFIDKFPRDVVYDDEEDDDEDDMDFDDEDDHYDDDCDTDEDDDFNDLEALKNM